MKQEEEPITGLPENAFRELKPGEVYNPLMSPDKKYSEVNAWSVTWGILMAILFSAAAAYLGLKVGQVFEAAIPIAIIAVGVSGAAKRKTHWAKTSLSSLSVPARASSWQVPSSPLPALYILQRDLSERNHRHLCTSLYQFPAGRCAGYSFPYPLPQIFRERHARQVSLPRGDSHHTSARLR